MQRPPDSAPYAPLLRRAATASVGAAVLVSLLVPAIWGIVTALTRRTVEAPSTGVLDWISGVALVAILALLFGAVPLLLFGAPLYALAARSSRNSWRVAVMIGSLPGTLLIAVSLSQGQVTPFGPFYLGYGALTAALTHLFYTRCVWLSEHDVTTSFRLRRARTASPSAFAPSPPPAEDRSA